MSRLCPDCAHPAEPGDRYCSNCGHPLDAGTPEHPAEQTGSIAGLGTTLTPSGPLPAVGTGLIAGVPAGTAVLVIQRGPGEGSSYPLHGDLVTVGRAPESDLFLDDITVSRSHAEFRRDADGWLLVDSGSLNGSYVNRRRVDTCRLAGGDEVQLGKYRFVFLVATGDQA